MRFGKIFGTAVLSVGLSASAFGTVIFENVGNTNPLLGDFPTFLLGGGVSIGGVIDGGTPAWNIGTTGIQSGAYRALGSQGDIGSGLMISVNLRLLNDADPVDLGSTVQLANSTSGTFYGMLFGRSGNDVTVRLASNVAGIGGTEYTVTGGAGEYNLFQLLDDDGDGGAQLYVNGTQIAGINYTGFADISNFVLWGDVSGVSGQNSNANYNLVRIETGAGLEILQDPIPEPASMALLVVGGYFLLPRRKRA